MKQLPQYVYFLRPVGAEGPVKIGCSARPRDRLEAFLHLAPFPLEIAATILGDLSVEGRFHAMFADTHSHHEWFHASARLTETIDQINGGTFDMGMLPERGRRPGNVLRRPWSDEQKRGARMRSRLRHMRKRGVEIPRDVAEAAFRWSAGPYYHDYDPHNPKDAELVEAFIADHDAQQARTAA